VEESFGGMFRSFIYATVGVVGLVGIGWLNKGVVAEPPDPKEKKKSGQGKSSPRCSPPQFDPPEGFHFFEPLSFYVLVSVPDVWEVREDEDSYTVYAKKKATKEEESFTACTVSCSQRKPKDYVSKFMKFYRGVLKRHEMQNITEWETKELHKNFTKFTMSYEANSDPPVLVKCCLILNEATGTVYLITFETQKNTWEKDWETYGSVITDNLLLLSSL